MLEGCELVTRCFIQLINQTVTFSFILKIENPYDTDANWIDKIGQLKT